MLRNAVSRIVDTSPVYATLLGGGTECVISEQILAHNACGAYACDCAFSAAFGEGLCPFTDWGNCLACLSVYKFKDPKPNLNGLKLVTESIYVPIRNVFKHQIHTNLLLISFFSASSFPNEFMQLSTAFLYARHCHTTLNNFPWEQFAKFPISSQQPFIASAFSSRIMRFSALCFKIGTGALLLRDSSKSRRLSSVTGAS